MADMPDDREDFDRFSLVSSLYGAGNVICWLCTLGSVFVTWTLNPNFRRKDSITNDFLAALVFPTVAAGHVIFRLFFSDAPSSQEYVSRHILLTSTAPNVIKFAAAVEAPLNVCETFAAAALVLFAISALWGHWKRTICVLVVGLFCFSVECVIFFQAPTVESVRSNLTRPYLFNFYGIMASIFAFLGLSLVLFFVILLVTSERVRLHRNGATNAEVEQSRSRGVIFLTRGESKFIGLMNMPINVTFASLPFAIVYLIVVGTGLLGKTEYMVKQFWSSQILFFIPSSGTDLSELDQAVALAFGAVTLLFSLYDAYESRLKEVKTRCEETELTENSGIRRIEE